MSDAVNNSTGVPPEIHIIQPDGTSFVSDGQSKQQQSEAKGVISLQKVESNRSNEDGAAGNDNSNNQRKISLEDQMSYQGGGGDPVRSPKKKTIIRADADNSKSGFSLNKGGFLNENSSPSRRSQDKTNDSPRQSNTFMTHIGSTSCISGNNGKNMDQISDLQNQLNQMIEGLEARVDSVIERHEAEFLMAYRGHMVKMKQEMSNLKRKAEEHEKKLNDSDQITALESQINWLKGECANLYKIISSKKEEISLKDRQLKNQQRDNLLLETQIKELMKKNKLLQMSMSCDPEDIIGMISRGEVSSKKLFGMQGLKSNSSSIIETQAQKKAAQEESMHASISAGEKESGDGASTLQQQQLEGVFDSIQTRTESPTLNPKQVHSVNKIGGDTLVHSNQKAKGTLPVVVQGGNSLGEFTLTNKQVQALEQQNPEYGSIVINVVKRCLFSGDGLEIATGNLINDISKLCKDIFDRKHKQYRQTKEKLEKTMQEKLKASLTRSELETFFLECIETAKKSLVKRKAVGNSYGIHTSNNNNNNYNLNSSNVGNSNSQNGKTIILNNLSEDFKLFRNEDKIKILELVVSNEKILVLLHQKIFPNAISSAQNIYLEQQAHNQILDGIDDDLDSGDFEGGERSSSSSKKRERGRQVNEGNQQAKQINFIRKTRVNSLDISQLNKLPQIGENSASEKKRHGNPSVSGFDLNNQIVTYNGVGGVQQSNQVFMQSLIQSNKLLNLQRRGADNRISGNVLSAAGAASTGFQSKKADITKYAVAKQGFSTSFHQNATFEEPSNIGGNGSAYPSVMPEQIQIQSKKKV